ncbi:TetR/AcrR family transcriptional regulator [Aquabacterium sp.]|uniref:TetR/AcrR family transcriptional regulator n=1 Tax=Aquabacterium sp. TaxID=1872578 RepID=UPI0035B13D91
MKFPAPLKRRYGGVSPEERQQLRRDKLIQAGIEKFGEQGYHATTVRDICTAAKLTERYFYESFNSMAGLFAAVYATLIGRLKRRALDALAASPLKPELLAQAALGAFYEFMREEPSLARICLIDAVSINRDMQRLGKEAAAEYSALVRGFIKLLYKDEGLDGVNLDFLSAGLIGMNTHIATAWANEGYVTPIDQVIATNLLAYQALIAFMKKEERKSDQLNGENGADAGNRLQMV